jgi:hypothetical protein
LRLAVVLLVALLAGCAELQRQDGADAVDAAVAEALSAARAPAAEQRSALARADQRFQADPSPANRLKLATLLAALPAPHRDDARAAALLEPVSDAGAAGIGRFAALLASQIAERQRLVRDLERAAREREKVERDRAAADKERDKREEALREQLEALRSIERNILEREDRLRKKAR